MMDGGSPALRGDADTAGCRRRRRRRPTASRMVDENRGRVRCCLTVGVSGERRGATRVHCTPGLDRRKKGMDEA